MSWPKRVCALMLLALCPGVIWSAPDSISLDGPLVQKVGWETRCMASADVNGDGLLDLVLIDNAEAKIKLLLQQRKGSETPRVQRVIEHNRWDPVLEDAPFVEESVLTGVSMYAVVAGDLDGDGLCDLAYVGAEEALNVIYQEQGGGFSEPEHSDGFEPVVWTTALRLRDVNNDGQPEILVVGENRLLIFTLEKGKRTLPDPVVYALPGEVPYGLETRDINGDGRVDILYQLGDVGDGLRVRFQDEEGRFDTEIGFDLKIGADVVQLLHDDNAVPTFVYVQDRTGLLETFHVEAQESDEEALQAWVYASRLEGSEPVRYALGDFDGDGLEDLVAADAGSSQLRWFRGLPGNGFSGAQVYPALANLSGLAAGRGANGRMQVALLSEREHLLALSYYDGERFAFPQPVEIEGEPQAVAFAAIGEDAIEAQALLVVVEQKGSYALSVLRLNEAGAYAEVQRVKLEGVKRTPHSVWVEDMNGDGRDDVLLLVRREAARVLVQDEQGVFNEVEVASALRKSVFNDLNEEQLGWGALDGAKVLLVGGKGFVRAVGFKDGELQMLDQYNARSGDDKPLVPAMLDLNGDGVKEVVFYDTGRKGLQVLEKEADGVYRYQGLIELGAIRPERFVLGEGRFLMLGEGRFWQVPLDGKRWRVAALDHYETDLEGVHYSLFLTGNLNADPLDELVMIDGEKHVLEVLSRTPAGEWVSRLHFVIFDENMHYRGRKGSGHEPRELFIEDFTGDGRADLVVLVHDRLLLYPQLVDVGSETDVK